MSERYEQALRAWLPQYPCSCGRQHAAIDMRTSNTGGRRRGQTTHWRYLCNNCGKEGEWQQPHDKRTFGL